MFLQNIIHKTENPEEGERGSPRKCSTVKCICLLYKTVMNMERLPEELSTDDSIPLECHTLCVKRQHN
jgi:hypothetical protein